jgi:hypothetical protein
MMAYDKELDNMAIYLTSFSFKNDPKVVHDEIVHKTSDLLRRVEVEAGIKEWTYFALNEHVDDEVKDLASDYYLERVKTLQAELKALKGEDDG